MAEAAAIPVTDITAEDALRAQLYDLLSVLLRKPPSREFITMVAVLNGDDSDLGRGIDALAHGSLCELMAGMIYGRFGEPVPLARQKDFFFTHIAPWAEHFFGDLEKAKTAEFYAPLGSVGAAFMRIEAQAFRMTE